VFADHLHRCCSGCFIQPPVRYQPALLAGQAKQPLSTVTLNDTFDLTDCDPQPFCRLSLVDPACLQSIQNLRSIHSFLTHQFVHFKMSASGFYRG
jgi:hypothetical protein